MAWSGYCGGVVPLFAFLDRKVMPHALPQVGEWGLAEKICLPHSTHGPRASFSLPCSSMKENVGPTLVKIKAKP